MTLPQRYRSVVLSAMAHDVARPTLGRDLETPAFWADASGMLEAPIGELERVIG